MPQIPPAFDNPLQALADWQSMAQRLAALKAEEHLLRLRLFAHFFPDAKEGTNDYVLPAGYTLKGKQPITREIDEATLIAMSKMKVSALTDEQRELFGVNPNTPADTPFFEALYLDPAKLVKYKPTLVVRPYRKLTAEQLRAWDACLVIKNGSPSMAIVAPGAPAQPEGADE